MEDLEVFVFVGSVVLAVVGTYRNRTGALHGLYFRDNPGPGLVRLAVVAAMAWVAYVLLFHADPSVTGVYVLFYLVMGFAAVKFFGQTAAASAGLRTRVDVAERRNLAAAVLIAAFVLATGLIFGGSLWGEADPVGDDEGGWWIPVSFFVLGWSVLVAAFGLYARREGKDFVRRIRQERRLDDARPAAAFLLASGVALTEAVSGDFWGWRHGLLTFGVLAGLVLIHEGFQGWTREKTPEASGGVGAAPRAGTPAAGREQAPAPGPGADAPAETAPSADQDDTSRLLETGVYLLLGLLAWGVNRILDATLAGG